MALARNSRVCALVDERAFRLAWRMSALPSDSHIGHRLRFSAWPLWAKSGLMRCNKEDRYSIISSARASTGGGTVRPRALAVGSLMNGSNLVGYSTRRSSDFVAHRILFT